MSVFFSRFRFFYLLLFLPTISTAVEPSVPDKTLGLQRAIEQTLERNPTLMAFGYQFSAQAGRVQQAGLKANPEATLSVENALGSGEFQGMDGAETTLGISWVLEGQQRQERVKAAQAYSPVLEVERDIKRLDIAAATARIYMLALALQSRFQQTQQAADLARDAVQVIERRVKVGNSPAAELARARVELAHRILEQEDIEHELKVSQRRLAAQWGATSVDFSSLAGSLIILPEVADYTELKNRLDSNPRLQYFVTSARWEESQLALAKVQSKPQWRLSAGVRHLAATDDQAFVAGVSVPLGVFDRQQGRITEARARVDFHRAEREVERIQLEIDLFAAHQELLHSLHIVSAYRKDILPALDAALVETRRAYDQGRYSYVEWQAVQRDFLDAQNALIEASLGAHLKAIEIERLTGVAIGPITHSPTGSQ